MFIPDNVLCLPAHQWSSHCQTQSTHAHGGDVQLANGKLSIHLKSYKHSNQFSTKIHMKLVPHKYCPVKVFCKYIKVRGQLAGPPLQRHFSGQGRKDFATLENCGLYSKSYNTHSFRIDRINDLAQAGTHYSKIQTMERFKSTDYLKNIKPTIISIQWIFSIIFSLLDRVIFFLSPSHTHRLVGALRVGPYSVNNNEAP